jgi:hypothetical protein
MSQSAGWKHLNASSATAVTLAGTASQTALGCLRRVTINTAGAASNTLTLYDSFDTSGTVIAVIDTTVVTGREYRLVFSRGLAAVLNGGATAADLTVVWD